MFAICTRSLTNPLDFWMRGGVPKLFEKFENLARAKHESMHVYN